MIEKSPNRLSVGWRESRRSWAFPNCLKNTSDVIGVSYLSGQPISVRQAYRWPGIQDRQTGPRGRRQETPRSRFPLPPGL
jgi:hypothetical protein